MFGFCIALEWLDGLLKWLMGFEVVLMRVSLDFGNLKEWIFEVSID